jgi:hypothetical protein
VSGTIRTVLATLAAGDVRRSCTPQTKRCDFWAWGEGNVRPPCCTDHMLALGSFVDDLLSRHGILHWLDYGTLLGAVREGALIPWDEDFDLGILARDVDQIRALAPEIEAAGHRLDASWYPHVLRIYLSKANAIHVDLFAWTERDGLLMHRADSTWDWPGMQDRVAFPPMYVEQTESALLNGRAYPAPHPAHDFLRLHRYGESYMTPRRATLTTRLHFEIDSTQWTPLVEQLLGQVAEREQRLLRAIRTVSLVTRMQLWQLDSDPWLIWTALPSQPEPEYLERELGALPAGERSVVTDELVRALAWLGQAIDEWERPTRGIALRRARRRVFATAQIVGRRVRRQLARRLRS